MNEDISYIDRILDIFNDLENSKNDLYHILIFIYENSKETYKDMQTDKIVNHKIKEIFTKHFPEIKIRSLIEEKWGGKMVNGTLVGYVVDDYSDYYDLIYEISEVIERIISNKENHKDQDKMKRVFFTIDEYLNEFDKIYEESIHHYL